jgi:RecJ-like exonuclease
MADAPQIKVKGPGSNRDAANLGQTIGDAVGGAFARQDRSLQIEKLRVQLPAGASGAEIQRAIRRAVERKTGGAR